MNTIDGRSNVAFGMIYTKRADEMILTEAQKLLGKTASEVIELQRNKIKTGNKLIDRLNGLKDHPRSNELTLDVFVDEAEKYNANVSYTNGPISRSNVFYNLNGKSFLAALTDVRWKNFKKFKEFLDKNYLEKFAQNEVSNSQQRFFKNKITKSRFADNSSELLPKALEQYSFEDLKTLVVEAPKQFVFKLMEKKSKNSDKEVVLYAATKRCPEFKEFKFLKNHEDDFSVNDFSRKRKIVEELLKFEKNILQPKFKGDYYVCREKARINKNFQREKSGVDFSKQAKQLILNTEDLTSWQIERFNSWVEFESKIDMQFNLEKMADNTYSAKLTTNNGQKVLLEEQANSLTNVVKKALKYNLETIQKNELEFINQSANVDPKVASLFSNNELAQINKSGELTQFFNNSEILTRFTDDSYKLALNVGRKYSLEDLRKLVTEAPERFMFKLVDNSIRPPSNVKVYVATEKFPEFKEFPIEKKILKNIDLSAEDENKLTLNDELLEFEEYYLREPKIIGRHYVYNQKRALSKDFQQPSKGLNFSEKTKKLILDSDELTLGQLKGFTHWLKRDMRLNFEFNIEKLANNKYNATISAKNGQEIYLIETADTFSEVVEKALSYDLGKIREDALYSHK